MHVRPIWAADTIEATNIPKPLSTPPKPPPSQSPHVCGDRALTRNTCYLRLACLENTQSETSSSSPTWRSPRLVRPTVTRALPPPRTLPLGGACYLPWRGLSCLGGGELCHKATRHHSRHDGALLMRPLVVAAGAPSARRLREWPLAAAAAAAADRSGPNIAIRDERTSVHIPD